MAHLKITKKMSTTLQKLTAYTLVCLGLVLITTQVKSQTPGGVATTNEVRFWYDVGEFTSTSDNSNVSSWSNKGGNTISAVSSGGNRPILQNNAPNQVNGFPVIRFDGSNDDLQIANNGDLNDGGPWNERTFFLVFKTGSDVTSQQLLYEEGGTTRGISFIINGGKLHVSAWNLNNDGAASPWGLETQNFNISVGSEYILTVVYDGSTTGLTGTVDCFLNSSQSIQLQSIGTLYDHTGDIKIGNSNSVLNQTGASLSSAPYSGDLLEFIIADYAYSTSERYITENYLSSKYDINIGVNDLFAFESGGYFNDLIGIGQEGGESNASAKGEGMISLSNPASLSNSDYLLMARDSGSTGTWLTSNSPDAANVEHLGEEWRVSEIGETGNLDLTVDGSQLPSLNAGYKVGIMLSDDGNFSSGAQLYELAPSGSEYTGAANLNTGDYVRVIQFREVIGFNNQNQNGPESSDAIPVVSLNYIPAQNTTFTMNYRTNDGTAVSPGDYTAVPNGSASITFNSGSALQNLPAISLTDDTSVEPDETFEVILESGTGYTLSADSVLTYTINDNDNPYKLYFASDTSSVLESTSSISIPVKLNTPSPGGITVDYNVVGGTAANGTDYNLSSGTLNFGNGDSVQNITVNITNNSTYNPDKTVQIQLSNPSGASLDLGSSPAGTGFINHELTIINDDFPEVEFANASSSVSESAGSVSLTVDLSYSIPQNITVDYTITAGTATQGVDFQGSSGSVIMLAGNTAQNILISILDDCDIEGNEDFTITISNVSDGTIGTQNTNTVTILDDDVPGPGGLGCSIQLWYKPDAGISGGSAVSTWTDEARGIPATAATSSNQPQYTGGSSDTAFNFQNYLTFDGSNNRLGIDLSYSNASLSKVYTFAVFRTNETGGNYNSNWAFLDFDRSEYFNTYIRGDGRAGFSYAPGIVDESGTTALNDNRPHIGGFLFDNSLIEDTKILADGAVEFSADKQSPSFQINANTTRFGYIGDGSEADVLNGSGNNIYYKGDISEIIYYEGLTLSNTQINQIQSYLALKYGITLNMPDDPATSSIDERDYLNSAGNTVWDFSASTGYNNGIAGLIKDNDVTLEVLKSRSVNGGAVLTVETASLNNMESIVWGHNGAGIVSDKNETGEVSSKLEREWRATEVGQTGNLTLKFDLSALPSLPADMSEIVLLTDDDGDFSDAVTAATASSVSGSEVTFTSVNIEDGDYFTVGFYQAVIWNGTAWENGSGSANSPAPADSVKKLFIKGAGAGIQNDATVDYATIENGADLDISAGNRLTVINEIINNGTVTVEHTGSLVQTHTGANLNSGSGNYEVKKQGISNAGYFNLWSSPIQSADIMNTFTGVNPCDVFVFEASNQMYSHDFSPGFSTNCNGTSVVFQASQVITGGDGIMDIARGYYIPGASSATRTFSGEINNGDFSFSVVQNTNPGTSNVNWSGDNWNLLGNPYPSSIDAAAFVNTNSSAIMGSVYFWEDAQDGTFDDADFAVWNTMGGTSSPNSSAVPNGSIASGQGFWVVASANSNVVFENSMRNHQNSQFFKDEPGSYPKAWLNVKDPDNLTNQILVGFPDDATDGVDSPYDAFKQQGNPHLAFGSVLDTFAFAIQGLAPIEPGSEKIVDLYLRSERSGEQTISLESTVEMNHFELILLDRLKNEEVDLKKGDYRFTTDSRIDSKSRFALKFVRSEVTAIEEVTEKNLEEVKLFARHKTIEASVQHGTSKIIRLQIYDVAGREVFNLKTHTQYVQQSVNQIQTGVYIVRVVLDSGSDQKEKIVIR